MGLEFVMGFAISTYSTIKLMLECVKGFSRKSANELWVIFTGSRVVKILVCEIHKNENKYWHPFFSKSSLYFAVKIIISTRIVNRFMNYSPTTMFTIRLSHKCRSGDVNFAKFCRFYSFLMVWKVYKCELSVENLC